MQASHEAHRIRRLIRLSVMSFAAISAFEYANKEKSEPAYDVRLLSETEAGLAAA